MTQVLSDWFQSLVLHSLSSIDRTIQLNFIYIVPSHNKHLKALHKSRSNPNSLQRPNKSHQEQTRGDSGKWQHKPDVGWNDLSASFPSLLILLISANYALFQPDGVVLLNKYASGHMTSRRLWVVTGIIPVHPTTFYYFIY